MKTYLKLCGNHSLQDLEIAAQSNATHIGVIFAESKRQVKPEQLAHWLKKVEISAQLVGVFVHASVTEIDNVLRHVDLDVIQCHGKESVEEVEEIKQRFAKPVFKAVHHQEKGLKQLQQFADVADGYVIDSKVKGAWGGTGVSFDWDSIPDYTKEARRQQKLCFIAGGINPDNVESCMSYAPIGIDLSSGIETEGRKNNLKLQQLVERMTEYEHRVS
jgi:phosphoribosylanthranilate isomerase